MATLCNVAGRTTPVLVNTDDSPTKAFLMKSGWAEQAVEREQLYDLLFEQVPKPDLVIYLQGSLDTLTKRIKKRGRAYEKAISPSYLQELSEAYSHYFYRYDETPLLVVNTTEIDFVNTPEHFEQLVEQVRNAQKGTQYYVPLGS